MKLVAWGQTDVGRVREHNEDYYVMDPSLWFYMVADGVGGASAGEVASNMACQYIHKRIQQAFDGLGKEDPPLNDAMKCQRIMLSLQGAFNEASEAIFTRGQQDPACRGMSTTAVCLVVIGANAVVGHVGDSRLYMIRSDQIYQITEDHTLVRELIRRGALTPEQALEYPHRNVISKAVGLKPTADADLIYIDVVAGDRFLLCTDGITDLVSHNDIHQELLQNDARTACEALIKRALANGGTDNITTLAVDVQTAASSSGLRTEQKVDSLQEVFLFKDLSFPEVVRVMRHVREIRVNTGDVIIREGELGDDFFILADGEAIVTQNGVFLTRIAKGGHFGELALIRDGVRTATVSAAAPCVLLALRRHDFFDLMNTDHLLSVRLMWRFLRNLGSRVHDLSGDLAATLKGSKSE